MLYRVTSPHDVTPDPTSKNRRPPRSVNTYEEDDRRSPSASRTLRGVVESLPDPRKKHPRASRWVADPVYPGEGIRSGDLRDHLEDTRWRLTFEERRLTQERKERDRIYGAMNYPDDLDRPSRTITATRTHGSRMTIVIPCGPRGSGRRTLTLRECASVQGFPLSYQFWADTLGNKDIMVGNAVSPPAAFAIAQSIRREEGKETLARPKVDPPGDLPGPVAVSRRSVRRFPVRRRFRSIVPVDWRHEHRVELENQCSPLRPTAPTRTVPTTRWKNRLYLGYARRYKQYDLDLGTSMGIARVLAREPDLGITEKELVSFLLPVVRTCENGFPDGRSLQARWAGLSNEGDGPTSIVRWVASRVDAAFPRSQWNTTTVPKALTQPLLSPRMRDRGKDPFRGQPEELSIRLAMTCLALSVVCERLNGGREALSDVRAAVESGRLPSPGANLRE